MAELTFKSAGVSSREIDLSFPSQTQPTGVPAGIVGTSNEGPAFIPITVSNFSEFQSLFGVSDGKKFGPIAVAQWLQNANSCTYVRVLGVGDGKKRNNDGTVTRAGFLVGEELPDGTRTVGVNSYANAGGATGTGPLGRTHFLGCFMSESNGSNFLSDAGIQSPASTVATLQLCCPTSSSVTGRTIIFRNPDGTSFTMTCTPGDPQTKSVIGGTINSAVTFVAALKISLDAAAAAGDIDFTVGAIEASTDESPENVCILLTTKGRGRDMNHASISGNLFTGGNLLTHTKDQGASTGVGGFLGGSGGASPIIRGVLLTPSGVIATLSGSAHTNKSTKEVSENPAFVDGNIFAGSSTGSIQISNSNFTMYLNGHKGTSTYPNIITASFDLTSPRYFSNVFNTNPENIQKAGHLLYGNYDIHSKIAVVTGSGAIVGSNSSTHENIAFMLTSSIGRTASATSVIPAFENFRDRFRHAVSPYVISQNSGGVFKNLFRFHALSAGSSVNQRFKVSIENIARRNETTYVSFDVVIRDYSDADEQKIILESFRNINLDPNSNRFIGRAIGDINVFYDFDKLPADQRINIKGDFPVRSRFVRVELTDAVKAGDNDVDILPFGYRGPLTLNTSGSILSYNNTYVQSTLLQQAQQPPVPYRKNITIGIGTKKRVDTRFYWGLQNTKIISAVDPNTSAPLDPTVDTLVKYFPRQMTNAANFVSADDDRANNIFNLSRIVVVTGSNKKANAEEWKKAVYFRNGSITGSTAQKTRAFQPSDLEIASNRKFAKFTLPMQGGFDGVNIFDSEKVNLSNNAALNEVLDSTQGGNTGPTVNAYKKGIDVIGSKADSEIQLLAVPGIREPVVTNHAVTVIENRFDALYLMDVQEYDNAGNLITGSVGNINVKNTAESFGNRTLDSSFAAAYFPDVYLEDPSTKTKLFVPPSVAALGAFGLNDAVAHPWFAPAGFTRGALRNVEAASVKLSRQNLDDLYENKINPITSFPGTGLVIFGQKTLLEAASSLDRINVRRLLINVRRSVRNVANSLLFEPNREETLERFNALVNPILQRVQDKGGVDRFRVIIDTTTTTQADVENNTIRGKIFLQPTRTVEFIALDFVVTNAGAEI
jgi:phage tail sheath protein FI